VPLSVDVALIAEWCRQVGAGGPLCPLFDRSLWVYKLHRRSTSQWARLSKEAKREAVPVTVELRPQVPQVPVH
jgi:hypothetical protein